MNVLHALPIANQANLLGRSFFPNLILPPFTLGLHGVFYLSAALASFLRGKRYIHEQATGETRTRSATLKEEKRATQ